MPTPSMTVEQKQEAVDALETGGVIVESFQSTAARDAWHSAAGYRSGRSMTSIVLHNVAGEIARQKVNIL